MSSRLGAESSSLRSATACFNGKNSSIVGHCSHSDNANPKPYHLRDFSGLAGQFCGRVRRPSGCAAVFVAVMQMQGCAQGGLGVPKPGLLALLLIQRIIYANSIAVMRVGQCKYLKSVTNRNICPGDGQFSRGQKEDA